MPEETETKITFNHAQCEHRFNQLNEELKKTIIEGTETYTPRVVVLRSNSTYFSKDNLSDLLQIDGFIGIKRSSSFKYTGSEIIFEKQ